MTATLTLNNCPYRYTISDTCKKFTLRDNGFEETVRGDYKLSRTMMAEGFMIMITIDQTLQNGKMMITDITGLKPLDLFAKSIADDRQTAFLAFMDQLVAHQVFIKKEA